MIACWDLEMPGPLSETMNSQSAGFSVARTTTGVFTITFDESYYALVSVSASLQLATAADQFVQVGSYSATAKTIVLRVWDISDAAAAFLRKACR